MIKKIILILFVVLLTGCQIKYELNFNGDNLIEKINVKISNENEKQISDLKKYTAFSIFDNSTQKLYKTKYNDGNSYFTAKYEYTYNFDEFRHALYINSCFDAFSFVTNNNDYILSTSKGFKCMFVDYNEVDSVEIIITSNHEIIESNADELKNNKLIWNINDENAKDKQIYVKFGELRELNFFEKIFNFIIDNLLTISIFGGLFVIIAIVIVIIVVIGKKNNEI